MEILLKLDESLFCLINQGMSSNLLDSILVPLRHKLFWIPIYLFLIIFIYLNYLKSRWLIFAFVAVCIFSSDFASSKLIKNSVKRPRPCHVEKLDTIHRIPCSNGYSFTSSHATNHFAISSFLFMIFGFWNRRWLFLLWAGIIGFAQIYVGVHYPFDVIIGAFLGMGIGFLVYFAYAKTYLQINK